VHIGRAVWILCRHGPGSGRRTAGNGGQPARRTFCGNVTYTDWQRDTYFHAVGNLTGGVKRLWIEFDHVKSTP